MFSVTVCKLFFVSGVNSYVTRIAMDLNQVLEELSVFANDPAVNDEIMRGIVTKVCEEVNRLFFVAPGFNVNGALQVSSISIREFKSTFFNFFVEWKSLFFTGNIGYNGSAFRYWTLYVEGGREDA